MDTELKKQAEVFADEIVERFKKALLGPQYPLQAEDLTIYTSLYEFGWFKEYPLNTNPFVTAMLLSFRKYEKLLYEKNHPKSDKPKLSKWEMVVGKKPTKGRR